MGTSLMSSNSMAAFEVLSYDLRLWESGRDHNTDDYQDNFVIRRGGAFNLTIKTKDFNPEKSKFHFELKTGDRPRKKDDTWVQIEKDPEKDRDDFFYEVTSKLDTEVRVKIWGPVTALVSAYRFALVDKASKKECPIEKVLYIIFNPWNEQDEVYMRDADRRREYVLNDFGYVYWSGHKPKPWNFAQFTDEALRCTFKLLEMARRVGYRDTARDVARHISSAANSCDNYGLLVGNWTDDFSGGKKPWHWSGSRAIFKKYLETNSSVKYGQCWVFSGVTTSMMRCLGIPARSVTNYNSSHDCDGNCTDDKYFDEELNYLDECSYDSVWNFHVWNDVWMARPDLPEGMGGWQAIDGTPQEESAGVYRCGPAPLQAIKEGRVMIGSDTKFVFAEVNADTVYWHRQPDGEYKPFRVKPNTVGSAILTKKANAYSPENILNEYKYKEGSILERAAVRRVMKKVKNPVLEKMPEDVEFKAHVPMKAETHEELGVRMTAINNRGDTTFTIKALVVAHVVRYNGVKLKTLEQRASEEVLKGMEDIDIKFMYEMSEFAQFLDENISLRFFITAKVLETGQIYATEKICDIPKPQLQVQILENESKQVMDGDTVKVQITVPKIAGIEKYTKAELSIETNLMLDNESFELSDEEVNSSSGTFERSFKVFFYNPKERKCNLNFDFDAEEISGLEETVELQYKPKPLGLLGISFEQEQSQQKES